MTRLIMVGKCPKCGTQVTAKYPFQIGICPHCNPSTEVPLQLAIIPTPKIQRAIEVVEKHSGVTAEKFLAELLEETSKALVRGLEVDKKKKEMSHPNIKLV